jgi:mycothiol synthase
VSFVFEMSWQSGLDPAAADEARTFLSAVTGADGVAPLSEDAVLHLGGAATEHLLARDGAGALVGFVHVDTSDADDVSAELAVHPDHRRQGLGGRLVSELVERHPKVRVWAHGGHPGATALAERFGFRRARELWQLGRDLADPVEQLPLPDGVRLRSFVVGADEAEFLRVNNAAFDWHPEQGGWDVGQVQLREAEPWFDPAGFLLAVDEQDRLLGYHWTKVHDTTPPVGEVYVLGVDPAERGRKLGAVLTAAGLAYLRDRGLERVMLYVEADNTAAVRVYEALGFTRWGADISYAR